MKKIILPFISVLIILVLAALIIPSFIDWNQYKDQIVAKAKETMGFELSLNGDIGAAILPTPHITLNNVAVSSGTNETLPVAFDASVEKASVYVALFPLLSGEIEIADISIIEPTINATERKITQQADDNEASTDAVTSDSKDGESNLSVKVDLLYIEKAKLSYTTLAGDTQAVTINALSTKADSLKGPFTIDGDIVYNDMPVTVKGDVGALSQTEPTQINGVVSGNGYSVNVSGIVDMTADTPALQAETKLSIPSIHQLAVGFGAQKPSMKDMAIAFDGMVQASAKAVKITNGVTQLAGQSMPTKLSFDAQKKAGQLSVSNIPGQGALDMDLSLSDNGTMSAKGQIHMDAIKQMAVDTLGVVEASVFDNPNIPQSVRGDFSVTKNEKTITFKSSELDFGAYIAKAIAMTYQSGDTPTIQASVGDFSGAKFSASGVLDASKGIKIHFDHPNMAKFIKTFQSDFNATQATSQSIAFDGTVLKNDNGVIQANGIVAKIGSTTAKGNVSYDNAGAVPSVVAKLSFDTLDTQALMGGKTSAASTTGGGASTSSATPKSTAAPWTRDAIDTSFMRMMNLDVKVAANQLVHGTWAITKPNVALTLKNGVLDVTDMSGGLFGGTLNMTAQAQAKVDGQPLSVSATIAGKNVDMAILVKAGLSQSNDRIKGVADFNVKLTSSGLSSSALIYGLNGDGAITTQDKVTVIGLDLAKVTEAISDESLTDLAAVIQGAFNSGTTEFNAINFPIVIREGTMDVDNFALVSPTAQLISDGTVSFSQWQMNLKNTIDFTDPDDLPSVDMTLKGPLNAPQKNVANDILTSFIKNKYGAKIQKKVNELIGDKLGTDTPAGQLLNNLLGGFGQ